MTLGLRFTRGQARVLASIAERLHHIPGAHDQVVLFRQAADSARTGEPLLVECEEPSEAVAIADGFTIWGAARPTVEDLCQPRSA